MAKSFKSTTTKTGSIKQKHARLARTHKDFSRESKSRNTDRLFLHHVPWVAPEAYLHVIFKPAPPDVLSAVDAKIKIPKPYPELLAQYNGAMLFSDTLSLFGVHDRGQLLNRSDPFSLPPYNIESENRSWPPPDRSRFLNIGGYEFDGSGACIDRHSLEIAVFRRGGKKPYISWPTLQDWLNTEVQRLSSLFDTSGRLLVDKS